MAEDVVSVLDIASKGVIKDTPPISLPHNIFTNARNVRFKDGAIRKMEGELLLNDITSDLSSPLSFGEIRYFAVWENPNKQPTGCYYIWVVDLLSSNVTVGQKVYIQDHTGAKRDITPSTLNSGNGFQHTTTGWQHTLFSGGFAFIINNGLDKPHYILDTPGNTDIANIVLAELPGWDSYKVDQKIVEDTWNTGEGSLFDCGQKVDFSLYEVIIEVGGSSRTAQAGTPAGSGTTNTSNFVPGALPGSLPSVGSSNFQLYTDAATNTTITYIGGLADGNVVTVNVKSRNVVTVTAGVVESFGDLLVAGNLTEKDGSNTVRRLAGEVRTSDVAAPGGIPNNWNPFETGVNTADEFTLAETSVIKDMKPLQGGMYIYATDSIHVMRLTGNVNAPVSFGSITDEYGCLTNGGVIEYDGKHFIIGRNDIYVFAGNPGDIQSLADQRVRRYFFDNLNPTYEQQLFTLLNHRQNEIWICYPTLASLAGESDEALIWNYRDNTWTLRDLNSVTSGDVGPVKGGGTPTATLKITGNSGNFGYTNRGKKEVQRVIVNGHAAKQHRGVKEKQTITVGSFSNFTATGEITLTVNFPDGTNAYSLLNGTYSVTLIRDEIKSLITNNSSWTTADSSTNAVICTAPAVGPQDAYSVTIVSSGTLPTGVTNGSFTVGETRPGLATSTSEDVLVITPPTDFGTALNVTLTAGSGNSNTFDIDSGVGYSTTPHITPNEIATLVYNAWQAGGNSANQAIWTLANPGGSSPNLDFTAVDRQAITGTFSYTITQGTTRTGYTGGQTLISNASGSATTEGITPLFARGTRVTVTLNGGTVVFDKHYGEGPGRILDSTFVKAANDKHYGSVTGWDSTTLANVRNDTNDAAYRALFYNPDATQNTAELNKPNGLAVDMTLHTAVNNTASTLIDLEGTNALLDILTVLNTNQLVNITNDSTTDPTTLTITPSQFSSDASYVLTYNPFSGETVAAKVAPSTTNLTNAAEGNTVSTTNPTQATTATAISTTFDIVRPWQSTDINPSKIYPIFVQSGYSSGTLFNRVRVADLTYDFAGTNYISYFEKEQMSISPTFDSEELKSVSLFADGGTVTTVGGDPQRATLRVRVRGTNSPGEEAYLTTAEDNTQTNSKANKLSINDFVVASNYKVDTRVHGRFVNYRVDDANTNNTAGNNKAWNISGLQLKVSKGGIK
tara:strand:- start:1649 stop:5203 length:3555 start_codon:yes stop_codon:yes gene_type:complete